MLPDTGQYLLILYVWVLCPRVRLCATCVLGAYGDQKRAPDRIEDTEIQMVVSSRVGAGTQPRVL